MVKITAELVHVNELKPGDLFSSADQDYWDKVAKGDIDKDAFSLKVFLRTPAPLPSKLDPRNSMVYRLKIKQ